MASPTMLSNPLDSLPQLEENGKSNYEDKNSTSVKPEKQEFDGIRL